MATAIIVAAGTGSRVGGDIPKQFRVIGDKTVLEHTISRFESCHRVESIVLVLAAEYVDADSEKYHSEKLKNVVAGGSSRAESVMNGLDSVPSDGVVAVHDGARPLVSVDEIERTIAKAEETGAACLAMPVNDTIKKVNDNQIVATIDRSEIWRAATPQCFRVELLKRAFAEATDLTATDECALVEALGEKISVVEGSSRNLKITHEEDLRIAEVFLCE